MEREPFELRGHLIDEVLLLLLGIEEGRTEGEDSAHRKAHRGEQGRKAGGEHRQHPDDPGDGKGERTDRSGDTADDHDDLHRLRADALHGLNDHLQHPRDLLHHRHHRCADLFEEVTPCVLQLLHRAEALLGCGLRIALVVVKDVLDRLAVLQLLLGELLELRDALTQPPGHPAEGLGEVLHRSVKAHAGSSGELDRCLGSVADLLLGQAKGCEVSLLLDDRLVTDDGAGLDLGCLTQEPLLHLGTAIEGGEKTCLGLHLSIGVLNGHSAKGGERGGELQREGLAERGEAFLHRAEALLHALGLLLELIRVRSDLD